MSWSQLLDISKENRALREADRSAPPEACPIDGAVLDVNDAGVRNCPMGNYRWNPGDEKW